MVLNSYQASIKQDENTFQENEIKKMIILTFAAIKGGVGKTTLTFNFAEWLASKGYKVLLIDNDHQCNLTQTYGIYTNVDTIANIYKKSSNVDIHEVKENIDLIAGYMRLDEVEEDLKNKNNKDMLLYMWMEDNYNKKNLGQYDFVLVDCHPDFGTATRNAIAVSHAIMSPLLPTEFSDSSKYNIENRLDEFKNDLIDVRTRESYITAKLFYLANKIKGTTNISREFYNKVKSDNDVIAKFPDKIIFEYTISKKKSFSDMAKQKKSSADFKEFYKLIDEQFNNMLNTLKNIA